MILYGSQKLKEKGDYYEQKTNSINDFRWLWPQ